MTPNPPIKGHHLRHEGKMHLRYEAGHRRYRIVGGCECGALPPDIRLYFTPTAEPNIWRSLNDREPPPVPSQTAVKRWHREHKAELRKQVVQFEKEGE